MRDGLRVDRALRFVWSASPGWTALSAALVVLQSVVPLVTLYVLKLVVDRLTAAAEAAGSVVLGTDLLWLIVVAGANGVVGALAYALLGYVQAIQSHLIVDRMQDMIHRKSIDVDLEYYENEQYFDKLHRAQREAPGRPLKILQGLAQVGRSGLALVAAFAVLMRFDWTVVVAVIVASIPAFYYRLRHAENVYAARREKTASERASTYYSGVITTAEHAKEARTFGFGALVTKRYSDLRAKIRDSLMFVTAQGVRQQFVTDSVATVVGFAALALVVRAAAAGSISLGELVLYFGAFQVAVASLRPAVAGLSELYEHNLFLSALYEFLNIPKQVAEPVHPTPVPRPWKTGIEVRHLGFSYPGTSPVVLHDVSLAIRPGQIVALVGRNGSGKTTLSKLLCRLYDPTTGSITIDGIDLRDFRTEDLRREVAVVHQDFGRYHLTVAENIALGSPGMAPDDPRIVEAARLCGIHDDVMRLPAGYDTVLGRTLSDGAELSLGQWQKIALARTLVRDAQVVLLDEPTSSLDPAAEFDFFESFRRMVAGRSALIVSHRFSTVRLADRIYVLASGRVAEQGTHDELVERGGLYAELFRRQASYYVDRDPAPEPSVAASGAAYADLISS